MSFQEPETGSSYGPPGAAGPQSRVEWVLEETLRSRRFLAAMVVRSDGGTVVNRGFDNPDQIAPLSPDSNHLLSRLKEAFPRERSDAHRKPGEAVSFAGFGQAAAAGPAGSAPEYVAVSLGKHRKLLFRPLEVGEGSMTLVLLTESLPENTDSILEGIGRAVTTCLNTDWSSLDGS